MDTSEYMPMFLAEAQEHLQELNLAIVRLEHDPADRETVDEIFRIAHSFKGMSATMGFAKIAELTHQMEDVFERLRQRSDGLPSQAVDTLLACLDALSAAVESIESGTGEALDPAPLIERLHALARTTDQAAADSAAADSAAADAVERPDLVAAQAAGQRVLHVVATLSEQALMPAVRAHMVFAALTEHGEIVASDPGYDEADNFSGQRIEVWVASEHEEEAVARTVGLISDVAGVQVNEVGAPQSVPDPAPSVVAQPVAAAAAVIEDPGDPTPVAGAVAPAAPADTPAAPAAAVAAAPKATSSAARTVRVDAERLDALMHSMGELVIHRTAVEALISNLDVAGLQQAMQELTRSSQALQSMVMQVRMIPVEVVFLRFPRLVRDLSTKLGKEVELKLVGSDTELDRTVVDALGDPLVHLVRNSLDHGLEPADERVAAGKPRVGTLEIAARHAGGSVVIEVRDDGHGINPKAIARKALEQGMIDAEAAANITMKSAVELLFAAGFSTVETTSDISGRGVGMDAVRAKIRELGGEVVVDSTEGVGTLAQIRLPLTLAIVSALHVDIAGDPYAIPLDRVERTLRLSEQTVRSVAGRRMLVLDDGVLQLLEGTQIFGRESTGEAEFVVIVRAQEQRLALSVDDLIGQRELVTRPLPPVVSSGEPVSGGAALADGRIALIVDCDALGIAHDTRVRERGLVPSSQVSAPPALGRVAA
jgi:two-component system chemotaxis sensor kinase CheA